MRKIWHFDTLVFWGCWHGRGHLYPALVTAILEPASTSHWINNTFTTWELFLNAHIKAIVICKIQISISAQNLSKLKIHFSVVSKTIMVVNSPVSPVQTKKLTVQVLEFLRGSLVVFNPRNLRHFLQIGREGQTSTVICRTNPWICRLVDHVPESYYLFRIFVQIRFTKDILNLRIFCRLCLVMISRLYWL